MPGHKANKNLIRTILGADSASEFGSDPYYVVTCALLGGLPICALYTALYWVIEFEVAVAIMFAVMASLLLSLAGLRARVPLFVIVNILNLVLMAMITCLSFFSGGIMSSTLIWLSVLVILGYWGDGHGLALFWGVSGIVVVCGLYSMAVNGVVTTSIVAPRALILVDFATMFGYLMFFLLMSWILYRQRLAAVVARDELLKNRQKMIQTLAHDLKNPVAGIVSRIYLMERRLRMGIAADSGEVIQAIKKDAS